MMDIKISRFIDDDLNPKEKEEVLEHINSCQECKEYYENLLTIKNLIDDLEEIPLPENFHEEAMDFVKANIKIKKPITISFKKIATYVASVIAVLFIVTPIVMQIDKSIANYIPKESYNEQEDVQLHSSSFSINEDISESVTSKENAVEENLVADNTTEDTSSIQTPRVANAPLKVEARAYDPTAKYIVYSANIDISIVDISTLENIHNELEKTYSVTNSSIYLNNSYPSIYLDIVTTTDSFEKDLEYLSSLGEDYNVFKYATDISDQVLALEVKIDENNRQKDRYLNLLKETSTATDMFTLENEITLLDNESSQLARELASLKYNSNNPSIYFNANTNKVVSQDTLNNKTFKENMKETFISSINLFSSFAVNILNVAVFLSIPFLCLFIFACIILLPVIIRRRRKK